MRNFEYSAYPIAYETATPIQQIDYFTNMGSGGGGYTSPEYSNSYTMTVYNAPLSLYKQSVEYGQTEYPSYVEPFPIFTPMELIYTPFTPMELIYTPTPTPYTPTPIYQPPFVDDVAAPVFSPMEQIYTPTPTPYTPTPIYQPPFVDEIYTPTPTPYTPTPIYQPPFVDDVAAPVFSPMEQIYTPTPTPYTPSYVEPVRDYIYTTTPSFVDDVAAPVFTPMEQMPTLYELMPTFGPRPVFAEETYTPSYESTPLITPINQPSQPDYYERTPVNELRPTFVDDVVTPINQPSQPDYYERTPIIAAPVDTMMEQTTPVIYSDARDVLPFIPDWNSLDCQQFDTQIGNLQSITRETRFTPAIYSQIQQAIQDGEKVKANKCASTPAIILNSTPAVESPIESPIKKVSLPLIIEQDGTFVSGGTTAPANTSGTFVNDGTPPLGKPTFVDDKKQGTKLPTAPVSKNLKPYVWALGGIVAILVVSRILSKKS